VWVLSEQGAHACARVQADEKDLNLVWEDEDAATSGFVRAPAALLALEDQARAQCFVLLVCLWGVQGMELEGAAGMDSHGVTYFRS